MASRLQAHASLPNQPSVHVPTNGAIRALFFSIVLLQIIRATCGHMPQLRCDIRTFPEFSDFRLKLLIVISQILIGLYESNKVAVQINQLLSEVCVLLLSREFERILDDFRSGLREAKRSDWVGHVRHQEPVTIRSQKHFIDRPSPFMQSQPSPLKAKTAERFEVGQ